MKKIAGVFVLGTLVILCFGLLVVFNAPAQQQTQNRDLVNAINSANHQIDWAAATTLISNVKNNLKTGVNLSAATTAKAKGVTGGVFARSAFDKILAQPGCIGVRYYYGQTASGTPTLVIVGVNAQGLTMSAGAVEDGAFICPPFCD